MYTQFVNKQRNKFYTPLQPTTTIFPGWNGQGISLNQIITRKKIHLILLFHSIPNLKFNLGL